MVDGEPEAGASNHLVVVSEMPVITRGGKRYWSTLRFGYTETIISDAKRLHEVNSITTFMALEWAIDNGFDYYDIGLCLARPDDGLLKWKRRRGGDIDSLGNHAYMFVRLPKTGAARFIFIAPRARATVSRNCVVATPVCRPHPL